MGLRIEGTQWRSLDNGTVGYASSWGFRPTGIDISVARAVATASPFVRFNFGAGRDQWLLGAFAGYARSFYYFIGPGESNNRIQYAFEDGSGFVGGIEGGYSRQLGGRYSLEVLAAAQHGRIYPGKSSQPLHLFAFPVTVGIARAL